MFMNSAQRGLAMGMKYGLVKGFRAYHSEEATPEMDETAMQGAIGIIIAVGGVLIALYIIAVVVGSISYAVTSGNIKLSPTWNSTITNIDSQAQATFNLAKCIIVLGIKIGNEISPRVSTGPCVTNCNYRGGYPDDRHRCIRRPGHLTGPAGIESGTMYPKMCRTLNFAIA
jgi:hypothetical protein